MSSNGDLSSKETLGQIVQAVKTLKMPKVNFDNSHYFEEGQTTKLEDIRTLLDEDSIKSKMEAMKRLIAMITKGRDVSSLFPHVAKNVVTKNVELKKLVYMFLVHYAEQEQDAALLAINSFQKDLAASNQYIRASALRVMSSIRVKIIVQLIVMAIQKCVKDSSPYVRKAAAFAIPKVFNLDRDQQTELVEAIKILLADKSVLVLGSAVCAFNQVCPNSFELIHPHFRKICHFLADLEEWGQIATLEMLLKYGRTQFLDPNKAKMGGEKKKKPKKDFLKLRHDESEEEEEDDESESEGEDLVDLDPDHRLLLDSAYPLLRNRNSGVVLGVASVYFHLAPDYELSKVAKSLVRISRSHPGIEYVVLANIATMAAARPTMFEPFLVDFFVKPSDPFYCRSLKLEIMTHLVNQDNINKILKEFKNYVQMDNKDFVAESIQAIGRSAISVPEVTDRCLHGLMSLLSSSSEVIVAESVVVIRHLLQMLTDSEEHQQTLKEILTHLARLLEKVTVPSARASITWVIGEYSSQVPLLAPDILRKLTKSFSNEDSVVKLQVLNLGSKLYLSNPEQTEKLFVYILNLAKYDTNYDVRDKARVIKNLLFGNGKLKQHARTLLFSKKPTPSQESPSEGRNRFRIGSLSHLLTHTIDGYQPLPDFPEVQPPTDVRNEPIVNDAVPKKTKKSGAKKEKSFWSDEEESEEEEEDEDEEEEEEEEGEEASEEGSEEEEEEEDSEEEEEEEESEEEEEEEPPKKAPLKKTPPPSKPVTKESPKSPANAIDDFFNFGSNDNVKSSTPSKQIINSKPSASSLDEFFGPSSSSSGNINSNHYSIPLEIKSDAPRYTLLKPHLGAGLSIEFSYRRSPSMYGSTFVTLDLYFKNTSNKSISNIQLSMPNLPDGVEVKPFAPIGTLASGSTSIGQLSVKFVSVTTALKFEISTDKGSFPVSLTPNVGDLIRAAPLTSEEFASESKRLSGMNQVSDELKLRDKNQITKKILDYAYLAPITVDVDGGHFEFSGRTMIGDNPILLTLDVSETGSIKSTIKSENTVLNSLLMKQLKQTFSS